MFRFTVATRPRSLPLLLQRRTCRATFTSTSTAPARASASPEPAAPVKRRPGRPARRAPSAAEAELLQRITRRVAGSNYTRAPEPLPFAQAVHDKFTAARDDQVRRRAREAQPKREKRPAATAASPKVAQPSKPPHRHSMPKPVRAPLPSHARPIDSLPLDTSVAEPRSPAETGVPMLASALRDMVLQRGPCRTDAVTAHPHFHTIPDLEDVNIGHFQSFTRPSHDVRLIEIAAAHACEYVASSSSSTGAISHLWMAFLGNTDLHLHQLSSSFHGRRWHPTAGARCPAIIALKKRVVRRGKLVERAQSLESLVAGQSLTSLFPGESGDESDRVVWCIDRAPSPEPVMLHKNVLSHYGHVIERLLTMEPEHFQALLSGQGEAPIAGFRYTKLSSVMCRSQLDCYDPALPHSPTHSTVFDLKSRAVAPIRYDVQSYQQFRDYEIRSLTGLHSSFESEYYDLARSAFLKYMLQCRMGGMNGIMLAFHNTSKILGFQMIEREEMEAAVCGRRHARALADQCWNASVRLLSAIKDRVLRLVHELHPALDPEQIKIAFASSPLDKFTVSLFVECHESVARPDADALDALVRSRTIVDCLDVLDTPSLEQIARAHEVNLNRRPGEQHADYRFYLINVLEGALMKTVARELPPLAHFVGLAERNALLKLNLTVHHAIDGHVISRPPAELTVGEMEALQSHFTIDESPPHSNPTHIAKEYVSVLIASRIGMGDEEIPFDTEAEDLVAAIQKDLADNGGAPGMQLPAIPARPKVEVSYVDLRAKMSLNAHDRFCRQKQEYERAQSSSS